MENAEAGMKIWDFSCPTCGQTCRPVYVHVHMYRVAGRNAEACKAC